MVLVYLARQAGTVPHVYAPDGAAGRFWDAEDYHQEYLSQNPNGYCNHGPNGVSCPIGVLE